MHFFVDCSESSEAPAFGEESLASSHSSLDRSESNPMIYEALQVQEKYWFSYIIPSLKAKISFYYL